MASYKVMRCSEEEVLQQLSELFGNVLNLDIIKSVAVSYKYDVQKSSNKLLEMSSNSTKTLIEMDSLDGLKSVDTKLNPTFNSMPSLNKLPNEPVIVQKKSRKTLDIEAAIKSIRAGFKVLVIMRGLPGSGKSYLAKEIVANTIGYNSDTHNMHILSTDDYYIRNGVYQYDVKQIEAAHNWNQRRAFDNLSRGISPVIIDNTNTQMWEMQPYATMATDYGYIIEILEPDTHWCFNDKELSKRNSHGVPRVKIMDMLARYEKNVTAKKLLSAYNLYYRLQIPPQLRLYPPPNLCVTNSVKTKIAIENGKSAINLVEQVGSSEVIDLMEFDDDEKTDFADFEAADSLKSTNQSSDNIVDDMLTVHDTNVTNILQPQQEDKSLLNDEDKSKKNKSLFSDIENSWGISENSLKSWNIVNPLDDFENTPSFKSVDTIQQTVIMKDSSSSIDAGDFDLWKNAEGYNVIPTVSRDISRGTPKREMKVLKKLLLDKSCMTEDIYEHYDIHMEELKSLFPKLPERHLDYWYNRFKGDLEWTIDFLLEGDQTEILAMEAKEEVTKEESNNSQSSDDNSENLSPTKKTPKAAKLRKINSDKHSDLKKYIESKVDINPENYSKHVLRIKKYKFSGNQEKPSTSENTDNPIFEFENNDVMNLDSDSDNEFEMVNSDVTKLDNGMEEMVELNLGDHFVSQLEENFADPDISYPKGFQPVVQLPLTLARQLYTFYIESVFQQMENQNLVLEEMSKEDEEFARKLQKNEEEENDRNATAAVPEVNLKDIMKEQTELNHHQKEADKWKLLNPDNLAARLTKQKLFNSFPSIERDTLIEILHAHDNKYEDTVESLLASTGAQNSRNAAAMREPPINEEDLEEMRNAFKKNITENYTEVHEATFYREEANKFLKKRTDLYQKAQQYLQRGMNEVAQFYSYLASQQTNYYERANNMAASAFLDEHARRLEQFNTLDLHFLYVKEAVSALDVFLDRNINLLKHSTTKKTEHLQIITGRGKRSENGISKLRPTVMNRLKKRNLHFILLNPGLLKVKITKNSCLSSEIC